MERQLSTHPGSLARAFWKQFDCLWLRLFWFARANVRLSLQGAVNLIIRAVEANKHCLFTEHSRYCPILLLLFCSKYCFFSFASNVAPLDWVWNDGGGRMEGRDVMLPKRKLCSRCHWRECAGPSWVETRLMLDRFWFVCKHSAGHSCNGCPPPSHPWRQGGSNCAANGWTKLARAIMLWPVVECNQ